MEMIGTILAFRLLNDNRKAEITNNTQCTWGKLYIVIRPPSAAVSFT